MSKALKTYIANFSVLPLAPGALQNPSFSILNNNRIIVLKNFIWTIQINDETHGTLVPLEQNTVIFKILTFGRFIPGIPCGRICNSITPPAPDNVNSGVVYEPGQYFFDNMEFENELYFQVAFENRDLFNTYNILTSFIIQVEEQSLYSRK